MTDLVEHFQEEHFEAASAKAAELRAFVHEHGLHAAEAVTEHGIHVRYDRTPHPAFANPLLSPQGAAPHGTTTMTIPSRTYNPGAEPTLGPQTLTPNAFSQIDVEPTAALPAGVTVSYSYKVAKANGVFEPYITDSIVGPMPVTDADGNANMDVGTSTNVPAGATWKAEFTWSLTGGSWTTGFTVTESTGPYLG